MKDVPTDHTVRVLIHLIAIMLSSFCVGYLTHNVVFGVFAFSLLIHFYAD